MSSLLSGRKTALQVYEGHIGPNMTPMVDVVMVILIFFMASASILGPTWLLRSTLPPNSAAVQPPKDELVRIRVQLENQGGNTLAKWTEAIGEAPAVPGAQSGSGLKVLQSRLGELSQSHVLSKIVVLIDPAATVAYADVVQVHSICQQLGIEKVGLASTEK